MRFVLTKEQELQAANIPFDETVNTLRDLHLHLLCRWQMCGPVEHPGLPELELHYKKLDPYPSFAKAFDCPFDEDRLCNSREQVVEDINKILFHRLRNDIHFN